MKRVCWVISFVLIAITFFIGQGIAQDDVNPNGFPSGPHHNLNIIGKKADYQCTTLDYYYEIVTCVCGSHIQGELVDSCPAGDTCAETTIPNYGNVVFVPEDGTGIQIYIESGKKGGNPKNKPLPPDELQVTDKCAGFDGDGAVIQLPPNVAGYRVYARALAKPTDNPWMKITPELIEAEDENGNLLVYLGLVTDRGFETPEKTFERKKGNSIALNITGLFLWSGDVCYFTPPDEPYTPKTYCCIDYELDGTWDECCHDGNGDGIFILDECSGDTYTGDGCTLVDTFCHTYTDKWVFNIGDFVNYLWNADNNGLKLLQVRFYPN